MVELLKNKVMVGFILFLIVAVLVDAKRTTLIKENTEDSNLSQIVYYNK